MKRVFIVIFLIIISIANLYSLSANDLTPYGWINDYAGVIDFKTKEKLTSIISELKQKTGVEIAIVSLTSLEGNSIEDFTNRLFEIWGVGSKEKNNGIMILFALKEKKVRIEVGYGLEGIIPDALAGRIIRNYIAPFFKKQNYSEGILVATSLISQIIAKDYGVKLTGKYAHSYRKVRDNKFNILYFLFFIFFILPIFLRNPWLFLFFLFPGGGYYGGSSRGGFGGGFGGFGSFGGGISGGGGATGSW